MTYLRKPPLHHPASPTNALGYTRRDYEGTISTLCAGCGHDAIAAAIIEACFELDLPPHQLAKLSGIGCSSKMPAYVLGTAHGFNSVHGRMPSVLTGANLANRSLTYLGVSGDGDTASIGFGQFGHSLRRGVRMVYLAADNGVYGLTRGQFSATADQGSASRRGAVNTDEPVDLVGLALLLGATFVARGFSGDREQLVPIIKAALLHPGAAFINCISPCVAFNNHPGSTKGFDYVRAHDHAVTRIDFDRHERGADEAEAGEAPAGQHRPPAFRIEPLVPGYDVHDRLAVMDYLARHGAEGESVTGLLYVVPDAQDLHAHLETVDEPLNGLQDDVLCPGTAALEEFNRGLR